MPAQDKAHPEEYFHTTIENRHTIRLKLGVSTQASDCSTCKFDINLVWGQPDWTYLPTIMHIPVPMVETFQERICVSPSAPTIHSKIVRGYCYQCQHDEIVVP